MADDKPLSIVSVEPLRIVSGPATSTSSDDAGSLSLAKHRAAGSGKDTPEDGKGLLASVVDAMRSPTPEMQLLMDALPLMQGALGRVLPSGSRMTPTPSKLAVSHEGAPIRSAIRQAGEALSQTPHVPGQATNSTVAKFLGTLLAKIPLPKTFQDLPLYKQMELLGKGHEITGSARSGSPIGQEVGTPTPFHELPLQQQMGQLEPPPRAPYTSVPPPTESRRLGALPVPTSEPVATSSRWPSPPNIAQTPFHELPLYQQMEQLAGVNTPAPVVARGRVAPPVAKATFQETVRAYMAGGMSQGEAVRAVLNARAKAGRVKVGR